MSSLPERAKKIAFFEVAAWEREWLIKNLGGFSLSFFAAAVDAEHLPEDRDLAAISVGERSIVGEEVLAACPRLEVILVRGRGSFGVDKALCRERNIMICQVPAHASAAVAEFTFALMLALTRKMVRAIKRGGDDMPSLDGLQGSDLHGKTLGVLGTGQIGSRVIRAARGFGMKVLAWNPKQNLQLAAELGFTYVASEQLLAHADIITVHLPYVAEGRSESTHHLFNRDVFSRMKRGALLVNTAHAEIIDAEALYGALEEGIVAGAAIDTGRGSLQEFQPHQNLIITPGVAYNTIDTHEHTLLVTAENIRAYFRGFPQHVIGERLRAVRDR